MSSAAQHRQRVIVVSPFGQHHVDLPVDVPASGLLADLLAVAGLHPSQVQVEIGGWRLEDAGGNVVPPGRTLAEYGIAPGEMLHLQGVQELRSRAPVAGGGPVAGSVFDGPVFNGLAFGGRAFGGRVLGAPVAGGTGSSLGAQGGAWPGRAGYNGAGRGESERAEAGPAGAAPLGAAHARSGLAEAGPGGGRDSGPGGGRDSGPDRELSPRRASRASASAPPPPDDSLTPLERTRAILPVRTGQGRRVVAAFGAYFRGPDSPLLAGVTPERLRARATAAALLPSAAAHAASPSAGQSAFGSARRAGPQPEARPRPRGSQLGGRHRLLPADLTVSSAPSRADCARASWRALDYVGQLDARIAEPRLRHCATIAVVSPKGGVGKTTVTALLGTLFSLLRRDPTVAVDTNPDFGSLGRVLTPDQSWYVDDLARLVTEDDELSLTALDSHLGRAIHGLLVVPAPTDPNRMAALDEDAYRRVVARLKDFFSLILLDCGTGLQDPASAAAVAAADQVVLLTDAQPATASLVAHSAGLLQQSGRPITVVVNRMPPKGARLDLDRLSRYLPTARGLVVIPDQVPAATRLAGGGFDWRDAPAGWQLAVRQLAVVLVADWRRLGLAR